MFPLRKLLAILLAMGFLLGSFQGAMAHPPAEVLLDYDGSVLTVTARHQVSDPAKHYVSRISVFIGGKLVEQREYKSQGDGSKEVDQFQIGSIPKGSEIKVTAVCSIMGSASGTLKVQ
ncbi:hypothetical protein [Thermanaerovibrio acidaminovorans]|uniref:hypothetical protein n=1 Tax=Thermanaerovibrio acidaminovorans TaxID=81462 RepID=UPI003BF7BFA7